MHPCHCPGPGPGPDPCHCHCHCHCTCTCTCTCHCHCHCHCATCLYLMVSRCAARSAVACLTWLSLANLQHLPSPPPLHAHLPRPHARFLPDSQLVLIIFAAWAAINFKIRVLVWAAGALSTGE